jgi:Ca-activated chloride channel family protein
MFRTKALLPGLLGLLTVLAGIGCDKKVLEPAPTLKILAGSEIKDMEPLRPRMERAAGGRIEFVYSGSLDAVESLEAGEVYDAVWLSHGKYLQQTPSLKGKILASEKTMASPVIFGLKASKAAALGWDKADPTWASIIKAAASGKFSYGMTNPASSNTGFTALVGVASALADKQDGLTTADIRAKELGDLFKGQKLTSGSSGWLADAYVREQGRYDGLINYESVILQMNVDGQLQERLVPVYPKEGIVTADYPLMLLNEARRKSYEGLVGYLRSPEAQREITNRTLRRPVAGGVNPAAGIPTKVLFELPFPASREVLDALIDAYQQKLRRPASTYFVLDVSGSMGKNGGMEQLRNALTALSGADATLSGKFSKFQPRERVFLMAFNGEPRPPVRFEMPEDPRNLAGIQKNIQEYSNQLQAGGGTAIFASVKAALEAAAADRASRPERQYSVVIMTDGMNTSGISDDDFAEWYQRSPESQRGIPVFGLLFGEAKRAQLEFITNLTGGKVFDTRKSLKVAFKEIRGYQ